MLPHHNHPRELYSVKVAGRGIKKFQLTVSPKDNKTPEEVKNLLKAKVKPTEIGVGITSLRPLKDGRMRIEAGSKREIEKLGEQIGENCGEELEVRINRLRNPRLVLLGIPQETTTENVKETLIMLNPELNLQDAILDPKFSYTTKRGNRNLVIEVDSRTRNRLLQSKVKMGWAVCKVDDYVMAKRCFKCSRYNHTHRDCKGEETCPLCTETRG